MGYKLLRAKKVKGRRWKKGQSSSSNPEENRFREAAKHRFFNPQTGPSSLTVEALSKHDEALDDENDVRMPDVDGLTNTQSVGTKTFNTWATNWTECTNTTFSRVHHYWNSDSAMHKEVLAVLAAITEVIKQQGGQENETEYFAALMTALETAEEEMAVAAISYLLSLVIKRVPVPVLKSRFSQISKLFLDLLAKYSDGNSPSILKSLLLSMAGVMRVQEVGIWSNSSTQQIYAGMLTFVTHKKPRVRKAAQQAVKIVLKTSTCMDQENSPTHHPAASTTAKYCIQQIEDSGGTGDNVSSLHMLALLKDVIGEFPKSSVKSVCETVLKLMTLSNMLLRSCGLQTLHGLFSSQPKVSSLSSELNAQIITAMYDYQPAVNDNQPIRAWLAVMEKAHVNLCRLDRKLCVGHLPKLMSACMSCLLTEKQEVVKCAMATLKVLLTECLSDCGDILSEMVKSASPNSAVQKIVKCLESSLSYQYHSTWGQVFQVWTVAFQVLGKQCYPLLKKILLSMANMRETHHFAFKVDLDLAMGAAVKAVGPRLFMDAVPLQISGEGDDLDFPRSWLIPVFRDNISDTELGFFTSYFLPLAARFRQRGEQCTSQKNLIAAKSYEALQEQIWSLLPGFCKNTTDLAQSFKGIAKVLGTAISERPDLRLKVMASLRSLITQSLDNEANRAEVSRFGKNFLPILFNLFTEDPKSGEKFQRLAALETIRTYLQICDKQLVMSFFDKCISKMAEEDMSGERKLALTDLLILLLPYIDESRLQQAFDLAVRDLESLDRTEQKKSYRILQDICSGRSKGSVDFTMSHLKQIETLLVSSLSKCGPSSKTPRLRCVISILQQLKEPNMELFRTVLPEAVLATKEIAERTRAAAYDLLMLMVQTMIRWNPEKSESDSVSDFFKLVLAGLAGSPQLVSGTLIALTRLVYGYKDIISGDLLDSLVEGVCLLLKSKTREVVKSALDFVKVMLSAYTETRLAGQLKTLISSLVGMKEDSRHHCRPKVRQIYTKLIRKFGYETILNMTPPSIHKLLSHIRKSEERAKKKKKSEEEDQSEEEDVDALKTKIESVDELLRDTDSEMEEGNDEKTTANQKQRRKKGTWLQEGGDDQFVDFLDPSAAKKVMATKPVEKEEKVTKDPDFKMSADGRLVITGEGKDEGDKMDSEDEDDLDDLLATFESMGGKQRNKAVKRKLEDDSDDEGPAKSKYKAGGSGIHRPLTRKPSAGSLEPVGKEYKAKKAHGDLKKKGQHDPYAYVPLNRQMLNKRKQARLQGQFRGLVRGAKKGAAKGSKNKKHKK